MKGFVLVISFIVLCNLVAQDMPERGDYRIMFYNVENLFDAKDDSLTLDDAFTPEGTTHWNFAKYKKKTNRIAQVIMAVGGWEVPELVGLCEVENRYVVEGITRYTPLARFQYKIAHFDSPDRRGIDVALLYQKDKFHPLHTEALRVPLDEIEEEPTRDILYVKGVTTTDDTLHVFVNHWPSKYGGVLETIPKRKAAAKVLRNKTDSLLKENTFAKIVIMGDFNTEAERIPLHKTLGAKLSWENAKTTGLYNLSVSWSKTVGYGSYKYDGVWSSIDQIIVSNGLLEGRGILFTSEEDAHIFKVPFLLEEDKDRGLKPFRTHIGMRYNDGFSDHLPIYLDLWRE